MSNKESNTQWLLDMGFKHESKNNGEHLIIDTKYGYLDLWPSTCKWSFRADGHKGQGFEALIESFNERAKPVVAVEAKPDFESLLLEAYARRIDWPEEFTQKVMSALGKSPEAHKSNPKMPWD